MNLSIFRSLRWRIAAPYTILMMVAVFVFGASYAEIIRQDQTTELLRIGQVQTRLLASQLELLLTDQRTMPADLQVAIDQISRLTPDGRIVLWDTQGDVLLTSTSEPAATFTIFANSDVTQAIQNGEAYRKAFDPSTRAEAYYISVRIEASGQPVGVLQSINSLRPLAERILRMQLYTLVASLGAGVVGLLLSILIANRTIEPIRQITQQAEVTAQDAVLLDNDVRKDEIDQIAQAFSTLSGQLRRQISELNTERSKIDAVLQQMSDGVVICDNAGKILLINRAAHRMFNLPQEAYSGHSLAESLRDHRIVEVWQRAMESGDEHSIQLEYRNPNLFLQCIATPLENTQQDSTLLIFQDLTRMRRLETVRRDFISNISHELRTPLASLKALTETLQDGALDDPPAARRFLGRMDTELDSLTHMVSELLELSRIESGRVPLQLRATQPKDILLPARDRLLVQAERGKINIFMDMPDDLPMVLADPPRMQQVIVNLLHNAIKFTPSGGEITLGARRQGSQVIFSVKDTGVGISTEDLPRIFERFYKADRARSGGGTGLGLAIARHLVEAHGGNIWAESQLNRGSIFSFTLLVI